MLSDVFIKHVREIVLALLDDWFIQQGAIKTRRQGITVRDMRWTDRNKERETDRVLGLQLKLLKNIKRERNPR